MAWFVGRHTWRGQFATTGIAKVWARSASAATELGKRPDAETTISGFFAWAKMSAAFTKRGVLPESGGTWLLPRLVGWSQAAEIIFTGRTLSAQQCLEFGLVNQVVPDSQLMDETRKLADEIADNAPLAVQASKRMMRMGLSDDFDGHVHRVRAE